MSNPGVVVRCGYCGSLICFHPITILLPPRCSKCGNDNCGSPGRWEEHEFGDFDFLWEYTLNFKFKGPVFWDMYP